MELSSHERPLLFPLELVNLVGKSLPDFPALLLVAACAFGLFSNLHHSLTVLSKGISALGF